MVIDDRENGLWRCLEGVEKTWEPRCEVVRERLETGDILLWRDSEAVLWIERKDVDDFKSSLMDGRYAWQKAKSQDWRHRYPSCRMIWLIEGDWTRLDTTTRRRLRAAMWKLLLRDQTWIWQTGSLEETAEELRHLLHQTNRENGVWDALWSMGNKVPLPLPDEKQSSAVGGQKKAQTPEEGWKRMLLLVPGMTTAVVTELMTRFPSCREWIQECERRDWHELRQEMASIPNGKRKWGPAASSRCLAYFGFPEPEKK